MNMLRLKNGSEEAEPLVHVAMMSLKEFMKDKPVPFYEFICFVRDPNHKVFGGNDTLEHAFERNLLEGTIAEPMVHGSMRNIVLSAVTGELLEMAIGNPVDLSYEKKEAKDWGYDGPSMEDVESTNLNVPRPAKETGGRRNCSSLSAVAKGLRRTHD